MSVVSTQNPIRKEYPPVVGTRAIGIIGSRTLPTQYADKVGLVTQEILSRGYRVSSGGAKGVDQYVIEYLLHQGLAEHCSVYSAYVEERGGSSFISYYKDWGV